MDSVNLDVQTRDKSVRAKYLLADGLIPAEYYGHGIENKSLQMDYQAFRRAFRSAGANTIISLTVDDKDELNVLVHDVVYHPVTDKVQHVDFINVKMGEMLKTSVPLEFIGIAPAVKEQSGVLTPHLHEIEVECLPKDLIHKVEVSIEGLVDFNSVVKVSDLNLPSTITILHDADDAVITCSPPRAEEAEPVAEEVVAEAGAEDGADASEENAEKEN